MGGDLVLVSATNMSSVHCFVSNGSIWYIPSSSFINLDASEARNDKSRKDSCFDTSSLEETSVIKNKSLLLHLNSPSLSDVENDINEEEYEKATVNDNTSSVCATDGTQMSEIVSESTIHALYFPDFILEMQGDIQNMFGPIKDFLAKIFPRDWLNPDDIELESLKGGITNVLLSCANRRTKRIVLMRVYGRGTNLIIDRHREFVLHLVLTSLHLAPAIYARFQNGLVYEYIPGRSLTPMEIQRPRIYPLIAQRLGIWHNTVNCNDIDAGVEKLRQYTRSIKNNLTARTRNKFNKKSEWKKENISNVWKLIEDWIRIVPIIPELIESFENNCHGVEVNRENIRELIMKEFDFLMKITSTAESPLVSAHCDLLSGNIILPLEAIQSDEDSPIVLPSTIENPVRFIDYEYMLAAPRAFDIANHLAEWQGFDCNRLAVPEPSLSNPIFTQWIEAYLNHRATSEEISKLTNEVALFFGMPGFYWGIWAMIQSEISKIDFSYAKYGRQRLQEYWDWKHNL